MWEWVNLYIDNISLSDSQIQDQTARYVQSDLDLHCRQGDSESRVSARGYISDMVNVPYNN